MDLVSAAKLASSLPSLLLGAGAASRSLAVLGVGASGGQLLEDVADGGRVVEMPVGVPSADDGEAGLEVLSPCLLGCGLDISTLAMMTRAQWVSPKAML